MGDSVFSEKLALRYAGDFTWNSMSGRSVRLKSVPVQSLSELERARLQEVAFYQLQQDCDLGCQITIPKDSVINIFLSSPVILSSATSRFYRKNRLYCL
ncbi:rho GTPase-activating protein 6 [Grus japonensis]|uniref:Rho GTPase-activating protein 6 n=1 Tax=Grus japonensis TaxID=30415 RepID=A0ABC9W0F9_GRUJA